MRSTATEFTVNPYIAIGVNPANGVITGHVSALLTAPGNTHSCKFVLRGTLQPDGRARLHLRETSQAANSAKGIALLHATAGQLKIALLQSDAPGDCDWVLEAVGAPHIARTYDSLVLTLAAAPRADWIGVATVRSKRAYFHTAPDITTAAKAYLIAGDVAYVLAERAGWYRVRFSHGRKPISGWIKASETF